MICECECVRIWVRNACVLREWMDTERMIKYWRGWEWIGRFEVEIMKIGEKKWDENLLYQLISAFSSSLINVKKPNHNILVKLQQCINLWHKWPGFDSPTGSHCCNVYVHHYFFQSFPCFLFTVTFTVYLYTVPKHCFCSLSLRLQFILYCFQTFFSVLCHYTGLHVYN